MQLRERGKGEERGRWRQRNSKQEHEYNSYSQLLSERALAHATLSSDEIPRAARTLITLPRVESERLMVHASLRRWPNAPARAREREARRGEGKGA
eukprot:1998612-Pleurochrysis_carterae.AAC.1